MRTVQTTIDKLGSLGLIKPPNSFPELSVPLFTPDHRGFGPRAALAVRSMKTHTTDEGWQIMAALNAGGYFLNGLLMGAGTDVENVLMTDGLTTVVAQDRREIDGRTAGPGFDPRETFTNLHALRHRPDVFKVGVLKDAQNDTLYQADHAAEIGCHAWVVYYHPNIVKAVAPYVRREHLVRTYHTVDRDAVLPYSDGGRKGTLLSGAVSPAYPLRQRLVMAVVNRRMGNVEYLRHPGYGRKKCHTPDYLEILSRFKVAICTASVYGYALRKIIEATAAGCVVVTDLPADDVLPGIDGNLVRVSPEATPRAILNLANDLEARYDPDRQRAFAETALSLYDYRTEGKRLTLEIENLRHRYNGG